MVPIPIPLPELRVHDDPELHAVKSVKARHRQFLYSLPEVIGTGVGLSTSYSGELIIQLYVRGNTEALRRVAPAAVDGVRVEIIELGEIVPP